MSLSSPVIEAPARRHSLRLGELIRAARPLVMGILNVTPDSFSDGGRFLEPGAAAVQAQRMVGEGADILDIGGESSRPYGGNVPVSAEEEWRRVAPALDAALPLGVPVSIDTMKAAVAAKALERGARIANDVWGLQRDADMARVVGEHAADVVVMHNRERAEASVDILADIGAFFSRTLEIAARAGIAPERIVLDPGIGFGKTPEQSLLVLARLGEIDWHGLPFLVGASRKRFIASVSPSEPAERLGGSLAAHLAAVRAGAAIIRAHDVAPTVQALRIAAAIDAAR